MNPNIKEVKNKGKKGYLLAEGVGFYNNSYIETAQANQGGGNIVNIENTDVVETKRLGLLSLLPALFSVFTFLTMLIPKIIKKCYLLRNANSKILIWPGLVFLCIISFAGLICSSVLVAQDFNYVDEFAGNNILIWLPIVPLVLYILPLMLAFGYQQIIEAVKNKCSVGKEEITIKEQITSKEQTAVENKASEDVAEAKNKASEDKALQTKFLSIIEQWKVIEKEYVPYKYELNMSLLIEFYTWLKLEMQCFNHCSETTMQLRETILNDLKQSIPLKKIEDFGSLFFTVRTTSGSYDTERKKCPYCTNSIPKPSTPQTPNHVMCGQPNYYSATPPVSGWINPDFQTNESTSQGKESIFGTFSFFWKDNKKLIIRKNKEDDDPFHDDGFNQKGPKLLGTGCGRTMDWENLIPMMKQSTKKIRPEITFLNEDYDELAKDLHVEEVEYIQDENKNIVLLENSTSEGPYVVLVGPPGAGKSTLYEKLTGLEGLYSSHSSRNSSKGPSFVSNLPQISICDTPGSFMRDNEEVVYESKICKTLKQVFKGDFEEKFWIAKAISYKPFSKLVIVVSADSSGYIDEIKNYMKTLNNYSSYIGVCVTNMDNPKYKDKEDEIISNIKKHTNISSIVFSNLDSSKESNEKLKEDLVGICAGVFPLDQTFDKEYFNKTFLPNYFTSKDIDNMIANCVNKFNTFNTQFLEERKLFVGKEGKEDEISLVFEFQNFLVQEIQRAMYELARKFKFRLEKGSKNFGLETSYIDKMKRTLKELPLFDQVKTIRDKMLEVGMKSSITERKCIYCSKYFKKEDMSEEKMSKYQIPVICGEYVDTAPLNIVYTNDHQRKGNGRETIYGIFSFTWNGKHLTIEKNQPPPLNSVQEGCGRFMYWNDMIPLIPGGFSSSE